MNLGQLMGVCGEGKYIPLWVSGSKKRASRLLARGKSGGLFFSIARKILWLVSISSPGQRPTWGNTLHS